MEAANQEQESQTPQENEEKREPSVIKGRGYVLTKQNIFPVEYMKTEKAHHDVVSTDLLKLVQQAMPDTRKNFVHFQLGREVLEFLLMNSNANVFTFCFTNDDLTDADQPRRIIVPT